MEGSIMQIVLSAVLVESVWSTLENIINGAMAKDLKLTIKNVGSLIIGVIIAINYSLDICGYIGLIDHIPLTGVILTGILISRGSSFIHDLVMTLNNIRTTTKENMNINKF